MPRPANPPARPDREIPLIDALLALACAAVALWVHRAALGVYFHPDDLISLERARGIVPTPDYGPWRLLSGSVYFGAMLHVFGTSARAYHALNVALHAANVVLFFALARRWGASRISATLAAALFGAARPAFSVLQQAVGVGELLAFGLATGAMLLAERGPAWRRAAAAALMLAALLSKEGVLLLPLVLLIPRDAAATSESAPWRRAAPLLAASAVFGALLVLGNVRRHALGGEAYATGTGANLFHNLMTYVTWIFDVANPFYDEPGEISLTAWRLGLPIALALLALAAWARRRTRLPAAGIAWALLAIAPVLPLLRHTYANYLYVPIAGVALALGAGLEALVPARSAPAPAGRGAKGARGAGPLAPASLVAAVLVAAAILGYANASSRLLAMRTAARLEAIDLPLDPQLRKSEMIDRAVTGLLAKGAPPPRRMAIYVPPEAIARGNTQTGTFQHDSTAGVERTWIYQVLDRGLALRALVPGIDSVAFIPRWTPAYAEFDLCASTPRGDLVNFGQGPEAHIALNGQLLRGHLTALAVENLERASAAYPGNPRLAQALAEAKALQAAP